MTVNDRVRTVVEVESEFSDRKIPAGAIGTIVECYAQPEEAYAVDLAVPDESLVGGYRYENVVLRPRQFEPVH